jgi:hypothetical protein
MQAEFPLPNTTTVLEVRGTWIPARTTPFGFVHMNGYHLLFVIFFVSWLAQVNVEYECRKAKKREKDKIHDYDFFEQPCAARWFEYAVTSPCMVSLIAASLAIRDVHTIFLLAAAQGALCQFGFAMECAYELRKTEDTSGPPPGHIEFRPFPVVPSEQIMPNMSHQLWYWSFVPSMLLHVLVWSVLLITYFDQMSTRCSDADGKPPEWLVIVLFLQGCLFTSFVVVAVLQALKLDMVPFRKRITIDNDDVRDSFVYAFYRYSILSAVAKAILGLTNVFNVDKVPLYTPA